MELFIIFILILLNGVFAMSEIAIVSARKAILEVEAKKGDFKSQQALEVADSPNRFLSTVQIGITLIGILNGVFGGAAITQQLESFFNSYALTQPYSEGISVGIVVVSITYLSLVLGELIPKRIGLAYATEIARIVAGPMNLLSKVTAPFIWLLSSSSNLILKILRIKTDQEILVTEEEIRAMVEEGTTHGAIEEIEQDLVERVFNVGDRKIGSLMTPRQDIIWLDVNDSLATIKDKIKTNKHSIFVLCEDNINDILGIVYVKDLLPVYLDNEEINLLSFKKKVLFIPETTKAYNALQRFKESKIHFAVIVDEYGAVEGVATINDIINAIIGGISTTDEFDYEITEREDGSFLIDAQLPFEDFLEKFDIEDFNREGFGSFHTLGGFVLNIVKSIPKAGETFIWNNFRFEVVDMDGKRIDKVLVKKN